MISLFLFVFLTLFIYLCNYRTNYPSFHYSIYMFNFKLRNNYDNT